MYQVFHLWMKWNLSSCCGAVDGKKYRRMQIIAINQGTIIGGLHVWCVSCTAHTQQKLQETQVCCKASKARPAEQRSSSSKNCRVFFTQAIRYVIMIDHVWHYDYEDLSPSNLWDRGVENCQACLFFLLERFCIQFVCCIYICIPEETDGHHWIVVHMYDNCYVL